MHLQSAFVLSGLLLVIYVQDCYSGRRQRPGCQRVVCGPPPPCKRKHLYIPDGECCLDCMPDFVKPGRCPSVSFLGVCIKQCSKDRDCPGRDKCCSNGCTRVCRRPLFGVWPICDEACPVLSCEFGQYTPRGECCPVCFRLPTPPVAIDCDDVDCPELPCNRQVRPPGLCCPVCEDDK